MLYCLCGKSHIKLQLYGFAHLPVIGAGERGRGRERHTDTETDTDRQTERLRLFYAQERSRIQEDEVETTAVALRAIMAILPRWALKWVVLNSHLSKSADS